MRINIKKSQIIVITIMIIIIIFSYIIFNKRQNENNNIISATIFTPKQSVSVVDFVNLDIQNQDVSKKAVNFKNKKIFIFADNRCGSCLYITFPLVEWVKKFKGIDFYYIELSNQLPIVYLELQQEANFYTFTCDKYYKIFGNPSTPTIFLVDEYNKIIWKRTKLLISIAFCTSFFFEGTWDADKAIRVI